MKKVLVSLLAVCLAVVFFELFLRFSPFSLGISPVVYDKDVGMWHKKNFSSTIIKECYQTPYAFDEKGLIKNNYAYDSSKKDILIFGDSYMEALMVHNENVMHNALYKAFNGKYNFINYGLSDISPIQEFIMMKRKTDFSNAKMVLQFIRIESDIYDVNANNMDLSTARPKVFIDFKDIEHYEIIPPKKRDFKEKFRDILGNFELYVYLKKGIFFLKQKIQGEKKSLIKEDKNEDLSYNWLQIKGALYQSKKLLKSKGITYKVLLYGKNKKMTTHLKKILKNLNIEYYDIVELAKKEGFALKGFPCDSHWTDETHQNVAKLIKKLGFIDKK